jgi:CRP-like cAMP-binding protein
METVTFTPDDTAMVAAIRQIPAFKPLGPELFGQVMEMVSIRDYAPRDDVLTQGEREDCMFFLLHGKLSVRVDGVEVNTLTKPNTVFGEMGIVAQAPRSATVTAVRPSRCLALDIRFFDRLQGRARLAVQAFFYKMFSHILAERLRETDARIADLDMQKAVLENIDID